MYISVLIYYKTLFIKIISFVRGFEGLQLAFARGCKRGVGRDRRCGALRDRRGRR